MAPKQKAPKNKGLKIGTEIWIYAEVEPVYENNYRRLERVPIDPPVRGWYVGYTFKQTGQYQPTGGSKYIGYMEPAYLAVAHTYKVFRVRIHERGRELYCFPEDCSTINKGF